MNKQRTTKLAPLCCSGSSNRGIITLSILIIIVVGVDAFATIVKNRCRHQLFISTAEIETIKTTACHQERRYRSAASQQQQHVLVLSSSSSDDDSLEENNDGDKKEEEETTTTASTSSSSSGLRDSVSKLVTRIVTKPYRLATTIMPGDPSAIGQVIYDASYAAVEEVEKEASNLLLQRVSNSRRRSSGSSGSSGSSSIQSIVDDAFKPMEESLIDMEESLIKAKKSLLQAKISSYDAIETLQLVALEQQQQAENSVVVMEAQREAVIEKIREVSSSQDTTNSTDSSNKILNLSELTFDDIDYESSEMAKPFLDFDSCLMTDAEPVVRVEKAPDNSRRIFAGIDILASTDDVWNVSVYIIYNLT